MKQSGRSWSRLLVAAASLFLIAMGFRLSALASQGDAEIPDPQTPVGLPSDSRFADEEMYLWNFSNDEWVAILQGEIAEASDKLKTNPEDGYAGTLDRLQEQLDAICALPETTAC